MKNFKKGAWMEEEDLNLKIIVERFDKKDWLAIAEELSSLGWGERSNEQCYGRWTHLKKPLLKGIWSSEEDESLTELVKQYGNQWVTISEQLKGGMRNRSQCRTRWIFLEEAAAAEARAGIAPGEKTKVVTELVDWVQCDGCDHWEEVPRSEIPEGDWHCVECENFLPAPKRFRPASKQAGGSTSNPPLSIVDMF